MIWYVKALNLGKAKRLNESFECFCKATKLDPNYAPAWFYKASVESSLERWQDALRSLYNFLEVAPIEDLEQILIAKAWIVELEQKLGILNEMTTPTSKDFTERFLENIQNADTLNQKALELGEKFPEQALILVEKVIALDPWGAHGYYNKAMTLDYLGRDPKAVIKNYEMFLELQPGKNTQQTQWAQKRLDELKNPVQKPTKNNAEISPLDTIFWW